MPRYGCNLRGECEENTIGRYANLEECNQHCQANNVTDEDREMMFIAISYDPEQALTLTPSDQVDYLIREYGIRTNVDTAVKITLALYSNDYLGLYRAGGLIGYLRSELIKVPPRALDSLDFLMLEIVEPIDIIKSGINWDFLKGQIVIFCSSVAGTVRSFDPDQPERSRTFLSHLNRRVIRMAYIMMGLNPDATPYPVRDLAFMDAYAPYLFERFG